MGAGGAGVARRHLWPFAGLAMSGSLADDLADTAFQLAADLDIEDTPRPAKRVRVTGTVRPRRLCFPRCFR